MFKRLSFVLLLVVNYSFISKVAAEDGLKIELLQVVIMNELYII